MTERKDLYNEYLGLVNVCKNSEFDRNMLNLQKETMKEWEENALKFCIWVIPCQITQWVPPDPLQI